MESLIDHVALVTGAAKRIGRVLALSLAEAKASVAITYRESENDAERTVADLRAFGVAAKSYWCDLRSPESIRETVQAVANDFGRLDLLVNNAGIFETAAMESISVEQWDAMFETNTRAPFLTSQSAYPHLKATHGRIINIGSLGGVHPWPTHGHYCTSKAALHMLTETMSKAFAPEISVNCVAPGMIVTNGEASAEYEHFAHKTPMRRNGTPQDVAEAVLFFATGPHFITGQILGVDGGLGL
ncbi:FolM Alternative dihydrofolate reductase 1 [Acidisarcina polymorpha]|uniref:FolM Alternative dihydrofolate reductase 1 n=1 Tax=Acidisarcina polymorpha TaxID=2211140 RepID=A0A2Z5FVG0_9BACT|nr:SDR family oxidoreductase [Acidisarcina polymorpha]AXC10406.1 FolM Alternative dihydrofolate reductase 1 [Acidisarcina polymorpha]